jgi:hypothetical protein
MIIGSGVTRLLRGVRAVPQIHAPLPPATRDAASVAAPVNWDDFDAHAYWKSNYSALRGDDRLFLRRLGDFFGGVSASARAHSGTWRGLDVGSGTNLYPALAMLPLCSEIDLWEHGQKNCEWLSREVQSYSTYWDPFWRVLRTHPEYAPIGRSARHRLAKAARVRKGNLFDLPIAGYDVGTMFFVAESITDRADEFEMALQAFTRSLRHGAPFAAAFMRNSHGYRVSDHDFPALQVDVPDIEACLGGVADLTFETVDTFGQAPDGFGDGQRDRPLRTGYEGMILVLGRIK